MDAFLLWIGGYNALGSLVLLFFLNPSTAQRVLGRYIQIIARPYSHGDHGPMFIWWAAVTNGAMGVLMVLARHWPPEAQREVTLVALATYVVMGVVGVAAVVGKSPNYLASGILGTLVLWVAQVAWGVYALTTR